MVTAAATPARIMGSFAERTGLLPGALASTRYLWTDAFAVCNYLGLFLEHGEQGYLDFARCLIDRVHRTLGRHRPDDVRRGWISGLDEEEGALHPTLGGLRIGKRLPERGPADAMDSELEWDRDGQYFHYLTKWMHALERTAQISKDPTYHLWTFELAKTACARFIRPGRGICWKMSIDLSRPLVASMGHHDPLDGFVTFQQIQESQGFEGEVDLGDEIAAMARLCAGRDWETDDMLGIGGLLCDAWRLARLPSQRVENARLSVELLIAAGRGLASSVQLGALDHPAELRLAFRELGLAIGLRAARELRRWGTSKAATEWTSPEAGEILRELARYEPVADQIERFWSAPAHQATRSWADHRDINDVMFATSLAPRGFLGG
jgi:hypothetical protein